MGPLLLELHVQTRETDSDGPLVMHGDLRDPKIMRFPQMPSCFRVIEVALIPLSYSYNTLGVLLDVTVGLSARYPFMGSALACGPALRHISTHCRRI
jgi:hypothetical protein